MSFDDRLLRIFPRFPRLKGHLHTSPDAPGAVAICCVLKGLPTWPTRRRRENRRQHPSAHRRSLARWPFCQGHDPSQCIDCSHDVLVRGQSYPYAYQCCYPILENWAAVGNFTLKIPSSSEQTSDPDKHILEGVFPTIPIMAWVGLSFRT
jgi:hypothetical protein